MLRTDTVKGYGEWPTLVLIVGCTALILLICVLGSKLPLWLAVATLSVLLALHSSIQHEVLHGHPTRKQWLNELMVFIPFGILIPYIRFRDSHLVHHQDERLTDPYDDPESNYMDPKVWHRLPLWVQGVLKFNNTLFGRILIGPLVGLWCFYKADLAAIRRRERDVVQAYCLHAIGLVLWLLWMHVYSTLPIWANLGAAYAALSLLRVRTFLEHQAHVDVKGRTVIVEDRGFFAFLFLNNNFHLVHHTYPKAPWYQLPDLYRRNRCDYLYHNHHYVFSNYRCVFSQYLFKRKDPVPHPIWPQGLSDVLQIDPSSAKPTHQT